MHMSTGSSPKRHRLSLSFVPAVLVIALCGWAAFSSASAYAAGGPTAPIHYYNGASRVDLALSLNELYVQTATQAKAVPSQFEEQLRLLLGDVKIGPTDPQGRSVVELSAPASDIAGLDTKAAALRAAGYIVEAVAYPSRPEAQHEYTRLRLTNQLAIRVPDGQHVNPVAVQYGLKTAEQVSYSPGTWILEGSEGLLQALNAANAAYESGAALFAFPLVAQRYELQMVPDDPLFPQQWHLRNTGQLSGSVVGNDVNIVDAWDTATGKGVNIVVVDDGVQEAHPDLAANMRAELSFDFYDTDPDPAPGTSSDGHGTSVSGVAAAIGNNSLGVIGSGFGAKIIGARLITGNSITAKQEADALSHQVNALIPQNRAQVSNNSWGIAGYYPFIETLDPLTDAALRNGVTTGRGGKGVIYLFAAGNYREYGFHVGRNARASSRFTIAVGASGANGVYSEYSDYGPALLVNAPSNYSGGGITTTDLTGDGGYSAGDYTSDFGGTSSATPLVSGIVALMLEANPNLTWRDVQHILVDTSTKNDPKNSAWFTNASGRLYNVNYGFGRVDAAAAVAAADQWFNVPPEADPLEASETANANIPDASPNGVVRSLEIETDSTFFTEHVEVVVDISHGWRGDLELVLTSPSGTSVTLLPSNPDDSFEDLSSVKLTSVATWGEDPAGEWSLRLADMEEGIAGTLNEWSIAVYGFEAETATDWSVSPGTGMTIQGPEGGPFAPTSQIYSIVNERDTPFDFEVRSLQPWITVTPGEGTVEAGGTTDVTIAVNEDVEGLAMGPYFDTLTFLNTTDDQVVRRTVTLQVTQPSGTRPILLDVMVGPTTPITTDDLALTYSYFSPVGRPQKTAAIRWYRDGAEVEELADLETVPADQTASGELWSAEVRASDGIESSRWVPSNTVQIANAAPTIQPLEDLTVTQRDIIEFDVVATDPDGDALAYSATVTGSNAGWQIDPGTGRFTWDTTFALPGAYTAVFTVSDPGTPPLTDSVSMAIVVEKYCPPITPPADVQATDGEFVDRVRVTFAAVDGATGYRIYRSESNDKAAATLLGSWSETTFDDFSAVAVKQASANPFACAATPGSAVAKTYYYWVAAYSDCAESAKSGPDSGYAGGGGSIFGKGSGAVFEKALPTRQIAGGLYKAQVTSELSVRLRGVAAIDPNSAWAQVDNGVSVAGMSVWMPVSDTDGWVVFWPTEPLAAGAILTVTVGASTVDGGAVGPVVQQYRVEQPVVGSIEQTEAGQTPQAVPISGFDAPPTFAGSVGDAYAITPAVVFGTPQRIWVPVPAGVRAEQLGAFYYLEDGDASAWYPADLVEGWLAPDSEVIQRVAGVTYYGVEVRHGGLVQLGYVGSVNAAATLPTPVGSGVTGDLTLLGLVFLGLVAAGRRYARKTCAMSR